MLETIYTIPVNEAFDRCASDHSVGCPFCNLRATLEENELELILGASMMEPDVRIKTNELGFCRDHYDKMFNRKNRLGLALMLESHLDEIGKNFAPGGLAAVFRGDTSAERLKKLDESCYVCGRIDYSLTKMIENAVYLWEADSGARTNPFEEKIKAQPYICLPHYSRFIETGRDSLHKKKFPVFREVITAVVLEYFEELKRDVSWFCKKFDYRYENEPWGNSKDAVERAIKFICGS